MMPKLGIIIIIAFTFGIAFSDVEPVMEDELDIEVSAQNTIPDWVKGIAGWWAENKISEDEFISAMEFLISQDIIKPSIVIDLQNQVSELQEKLDAAHKRISSLEQQLSESEVIPSTGPSSEEPDLNTEKGLAFAWSHDKITDIQYVEGIQKLVDEGKIPKFNGTSEDYNPNQPIPKWIKNNAGFWSSGSGVSFEDYRASLLHLFRLGILRNPVN